MKWKSIFIFKNLIILSLKNQIVKVDLPEKLPNKLPLKDMQITENKI